MVFYPSIDFIPHFRYDCKYKIPGPRPGEALGERFAEGFDEPSPVQAFAPGKTVPGQVAIGFIHIGGSHW